MAAAFWLSEFYDRHNIDEREKTSRSDQKSGATSLVGKNQDNTLNPADGSQGWQQESITFRGRVQPTRGLVRIQEGWTISEAGREGSA